MKRTSNGNAAQYNMGCRGDCRDSPCLLHPPRRFFCALGAADIFKFADLIQSVRKLALNPALLFNSGNNGDNRCIADSD